MKTDSLAFRLVGFAAVATLALLSMGDGCGHTPVPPTVRVPSGQTWVGALTGALIIADTGFRADWCQYIVDWGDFTMDTTASGYRAGETAYVEHRWTTAGVTTVKAQALLESWNHRVSDWSIPETVTVYPNDLPVVDSVKGPPTAVKNTEALFTVLGSDPDGDSIRVHVEWGRGYLTTTGLFQSPCSVTITHTFFYVETATVIVTVLDWKGTPSLPETIRVWVGNAGGVIRYWLGPTTASPLVINDSVVGATLSGHPAFCEQTRHIIVGSPEGSLSALNPDLSIAWQWPDTTESLQTNWEWGAPAIKGNRIYIGRNDDTLFLFEDNGSQGNRIAAYAVNASVIDAPAVDADGNVIFATDSGYLVKIDGALNSPIWRSRLLLNGEVHGPTLDGDGTIYCASESHQVYAFDPADGHRLWTVTLNGDAFRPAIGKSAIFVASSFGKAYSINPATGGINWETRLKTPYGADEQFSTTPIVSAVGYVYFQSENDVLYCVNQADGLVIWYCDCPRYLQRSGGGNSHRPRRMQLTDYPPNPTILSNGNIIVAGSDALYCVAGYPEGPLDPLASWPKWQHDLYNTGFVGGGR